MQLKCILLPMLNFSFILAAKYEMINDLEHIIQSCSKEDDKGNSQFSDYFDMSGLYDVYSEDLETRYTSGKIVVIGSLPQDYPIRIHTEIYAWFQNKWIVTVYSIRRENICRDLLNQSVVKFWFDDKLLQNVHQECSPRKGTIITVQNATNRIQLPVTAKNLRGSKVKIVSHFSVANYTTCLAYIATIFKI